MSHVIRHQCMVVTESVCLRDGSINSHKIKSVYLLLVSYIFYCIFSLVPCFGIQILEKTKLVSFLPKLRAVCILLK